MNLKVNHFAIIPKLHNGALTFQLLTYSDCSLQFARANTETVQCPGMLVLSNLAVLILKEYNENPELLERTGSHLDQSFINTYLSYCFTLFVKSIGK